MSLWEVTDAQRHIGLLSTKTNGNFQETLPETAFKDYFHSFGIYFCHLIRNSYFPSFALEQTVDNMMKRKGLFENMAKDRKVIPDPIDDRKFQE